MCDVEVKPGSFRSVSTKQEPVLDNTPASWSKDAVDWAVANKLLLGDEKGNLLLRSPITREQFCVVLKRYHDTFKTE